MVHDYDNSMNLRRNSQTLQGRALCVDEVPRLSERLYNGTLQEISDCHPLTDETITEDVKYKSLTNIGAGVPNPARYAAKATRSALRRRQIYADSI